MEEKMTRDIFVDPLTPISFSDTVAPPPPLECHVLIKLPLKVRVCNFLVNGN
jgi:hypothetical protein